MCQGLLTDGANKPRGFEPPLGAVAKASGGIF